MEVKTNYPAGWLSDISFVNNGRVFYAEVHSLGELPENEMSRIELFESVPENYTYDSGEEALDLERIGKMLRAYRE